MINNHSGKKNLIKSSSGRNNSHKNKYSSKMVELLSPAGNYDCFIAAISNGADAVYVAGNKFGARAYADNFDEKQLIEILDIAHIHNKKVYLTVNTILKETEIESLIGYIIPYYEHGLDGVIVQDMGVVGVLLDNFPDMEVHSSTQMSLTDSYGVELMLNRGISRVVLARELSLDEISNIYNKTGAEIECFIHGAMCYSYSGKCLFSSFLGGRSGNRGRCAQPCRLQYNDKYPLSMKDMNTLGMIPALIEAGIASFKIEGRMKSPEYVACVTGLYRKYIDLYYSGKNYVVDSEDEALLLDQYTRGGNCSGYYYQHNGQNMITIASPSYSSVKDLSNLSSVYTKQQLDKIKITGYCSLYKEKNAELTLVYDDMSVTCTGKRVEKAQNRPIDKDVVCRQLTKTGDTGFVFDNLYIDCDDDIFVPIGELNELRRNALNLLTNELLKPYIRKISQSNIDKESTPKEATVEKIISSETLDSTTQNDNDICNLLCVEAITREHIEYLCRKKDICNIIIPLNSFGIRCRKNNSKISTKDFELIKEIEGLKENNHKKIYIKLPYILRKITETFINDLKFIIDSIEPDGIIISSYESLELVRTLNYKGLIISDIHLYSANLCSDGEYKKLGINVTSMPVELNKKEILSLNINNQLINAYGRTPLMISSQCVRKTLATCQKSNGFYYITDRKNTIFPVYCCCDECMNIIYNSTPTFMERDNIIIRTLNPFLINLSFTTETNKEIDKVINYYLNGGEIPVVGYTKGHLNRGVE